MTPQRIGRYKILEEIARGGMAAVFLAEDRYQTVDELVQAVKELVKKS